MISHANRCIYIHIPKTAGTSIEKKLGLFDDLEPGVQDHRTIRELEEASTPPLSSLEKPYFSFTFVRNPWARAFSWYRNVIEDVNHQKEGGIASDCPFPDFLKRHGDSWALRPQTHWITDRSGDIPLDFVGRFERLEDDFAYVCSVLEIEDPALPQIMLRKGPQPCYVDYYDPELVDLVARRYREEIELFGYAFEDGVRPIERMKKPATTLARLHKAIGRLRE